MTPEDIQSRTGPMRERLDALEKLLSDPTLYTDHAKLRALLRECKKLEDFFVLRTQWTLLRKELAEDRELLEKESDAALRSLIEKETAQLETQLAESEKLLTAALIPAAPLDGRNAILEIRPAAGGEEAALFAADIFRMYRRYAEWRGWKTELLDLAGTELGGIRNAAISLSGTDVFSRMKYESGVHRVQRIPATETGGRIHTSTVTVSVLPEADNPDEIIFRPDELEVSTFRSSGPGGQSVNRTDSAVRIVHLPTGITVTSQQERSQIRNREIALRILRSRLLEIQRREEAEKHAASKRSQVGTGDRSERIRTYNFPQNRVTDHRFGISVFDLPSLLEGNLDPLLDLLFEKILREHLSGGGAFPE